MFRTLDKVPLRFTRGQEALTDEEREYDDMFDSRLSQDVPPSTSTTTTLLSAFGSTTYQSVVKSSGPLSSHKQLKSPHLLQSTQNPHFSYCPMISTSHSQISFTFSFSALSFFISSFPFLSSPLKLNQYKEDMKKFRKMAVENQELGSSRHNGLANEYGLDPSSSSTENQQYHRN